MTNDYATEERPHSNEGSLNEDRPNKWKFLVIADDTPEFKVVLRLAALRAARVNGEMIMLRIIPESDFQHWMSVQDIMEEEARVEAEELLENFAKEVKELAGISPELIVRKGNVRDVITSYIKEDQDVHMLVLGANVNGDPGPLVRAFREDLLNVLHMPVLVIPGNMTNEEIDHFVY